MIIKKIIKNGTLKRRTDLFCNLYMLFLCARVNLFDKNRTLLPS